MRKHWEQDKHSTGATNPRSQRKPTRLRGGKEDENQKHPRQSLTDFIATEKNQEGVACEESIV
jgi:hypothetical protein